MNDYLDDLVRRTVARHLDVRAAAVESAHHFEQDLSMKPLDIVQVALALEDMENIVLPIAELYTLTTVSDLTRLVRRVEAEERHVEKPFFVPIYRRNVRLRRGLVRRPKAA